MNGMWGYKVKDQNYKSVEELVRLLVRTSGKGANLLLNIGPQPDGSLPVAALKRLEGMGKWLKQYGTTIYGTQAGPVQGGEDYASTRSGKKVYLHILKPEMKDITLKLEGEQVQQVTAFGKTKDLKWTQTGYNFTLRLDNDKDAPDNIYEITLR